MLLKRDGTPVIDWSRNGQEDATVNAMRLLQYDMMFGKNYGLERFFPEQVRLGEEVGS